MARDTEDFPVDQAVVEADIEMLADDMQRTGDLITIVGQLDPTEIDLTTGLPRWTSRQQALIVKTRTILAEWDD